MVLNNNQRIRIVGVPIAVASAGGSIYTTATNSDGNYGFRFASGTYTVTASKKGYNFTPVSMTVTLGTMTGKLRRGTINFLEINGGN